jgi:methylenetetrahydrofolate reductase (NADPH)
MEARRRDELLADLATSARFEIIPTSSVEERLGQLPLDTTLTITCSVKLTLETSLSLCERLRERGFPVVPHVAARLVQSRSHLDEILQRLDAAGVEDVFVIGGDAPEPAGEFTSALELLRAISEHDQAPRQLGIAGYPEGHPLIGDQELLDQLLRKQEHAHYVVTQICLDPAQISDWLADVRLRGLRLPVTVGVPGQVARLRLLRIATQVGVGQSIRFARKNTGLIGRLLSGKSFRPDELLRDLVGREDGSIAGLHLFTFNEIEATERWRAHAAR